MRRFMVVLLLVMGQAVPASAAPGPPRLVFEGWDAAGEQWAAAANLKGRVLLKVPGVEPLTSIDDGVLMLTRHLRGGLASKLVAYDASTGERRYQIADARFPLLFGDGAGVVFLPDNDGTGRGDADRDPYVNSVWYKDLATGTEVKLAQFTDGDYWPMDLAVSPDGSLVAFTEGNDQWRFVWNIWLAETDGSSLVELVAGDASMTPAFSPDGATVAYAHWEGTCTSGVRVIGVDGSGARTLTEGTCDMGLTRPVWLDADTLVAWWWAQKPDLSGFRPMGLVSVDVATGQVDPTPIAKARVVDFSVSRELGSIAYRTRLGDLFLYDVATGTTTALPGGRKLIGWHLHLDGSYELAV